MQLMFARGRTETDGVADKSLHVNNVGYYRDLTSSMAVDRKRGRRDYHLIFVASGSVSTNFGKASAGDCVFYRPKECQRYEYEPSEKCAYVWVHYSGIDADKVLSVPSGITDCAENAGQIYELLMRMAKAVADGGAGSDKYAEGLLIATCALIENVNHEAQPFGKAISMMRDFSQNCKAKDYADASGMSEGHFIRSFKKSTGKTPIEYKTDLQIEYAKTLLVETPISVSEVATQVGFADALYFSRVFKSRTGLSPTAFRKQC